MATEATTTQNKTIEGHPAKEWVHRFDFTSGKKTAEIAAEALRADGRATQTRIEKTAGNVWSLYYIPA